jgi:hypothetical protein
VAAGRGGALKALRVTRRDVTAPLARSCLSVIVGGRAVSAQERGASPAVGDRVNRLERQLEDLRRTLKIPGISAAVVKDQKLLWVKGLSATRNQRGGRY